mmetsp:Transcript_42343/g.125619  ORF Transcript_42343/g.125619 Transcript_42343/m.125619 type:complete len:339 (+) Transcript_42343:2171-3187(+)
MNSTHRSIQASSSMCSTTCDTAMTQALTVFQLHAGAARAVRTTLKRLGMKTSSSWLSSAHFSAIRSRFSSPICTASPSSSSSSSSSAWAVQALTSSSTSSIHSTLRATICSRKGSPSGLQKSSAKATANDMRASMLLCRTSSSAKCFMRQSSISSGQSCSSPLALKNSGSSSAAEIRDSSTSLSSSSFLELEPKSLITSMTPAMVGASTSAALGSRSSIIWSTSCAAAARTSGVGSFRQPCSIARSIAPWAQRPSPTMDTSSFRTPRAVTRVAGSDSPLTNLARAGSSSGHSFPSSSMSSPEISAMAATALPAFRRTGLLGSWWVVRSSCVFRPLCVV